jgi:hypothetical protein
MACTTAATLKFTAIEIEVRNANLRLDIGLLHLEPLTFGGAISLERPHKLTSASVFVRDPRSFTQS